MSFIHLLFPPEEVGGLGNKPQEPFSKKRKIAAEEMEEEGLTRAAKSRYRHRDQKQILSRFMEQMDNWGPVEVSTERASIIHGPPHTIDPSQLSLDRRGPNLETQRLQIAEDWPSSTNSSTSPSSPGSSIAASWGSDYSNQLGLFFDHWRITSQELELLEDLFEATPIAGTEASHRIPKTVEASAPDQLYPSPDAEEADKDYLGSITQQAGDTPNPSMNSFAIHEPISPVWSQRTPTIKPEFQRYELLDRIRRRCSTGSLAFAC